MYPRKHYIANICPDLDSLCSALLFAYIRSNIPKQPLHIPLCNLAREDLKLRTELYPVLRHAGLDYNDLLTLSDLPQIASDDQADWLLVDHNALTGPLAKFQNRVLGCIDHHIDEKAVHTEAEPRVIEHAGSCATLIIDHYRSAWDEMRKDTASKDENAKLAKIALAPILIDSDNLRSKDKMSDKDPVIAKLLEDVIDDKEFNSAAYYKEIDTVKHDISSLTIPEILRKDYKEWREGDILLGISCAVQGMDYLVEKAGSTDALYKHLGEWAEKRGLDVASIMTASSPNGIFQRNLLVWGVTPNGQAALAKFGDMFTDHLQLVQLANGSLDKPRVSLAWNQKNLKASRKQVAPALREALKAVKEKL